MAFKKQFKYILIISKIEIVVRSPSANTDSLSRNCYRPHSSYSSSLFLFNRSELLTTETLLPAMANPEKTGFRKMPHNG